MCFDAKNYVRGDTVALVRPLLGNGLPLSDGPYWLRQRRIIQPAFQRSKLGSWVKLLADIAARAVAKLQDGMVFRAHDWTLGIALEAIVRTMFSSALASSCPRLVKRSEPSNATSHCGPSALHQPGCRCLETRPFEPQSQRWKRVSMGFSETQKAPQGPNPAACSNHSFKRAMPARAQRSHAQNCTTRS